MTVPRGRQNHYDGRSPRSFPFSTIELTPVRGSEKVIMALLCLSGIESIPEPSPGMARSESCLGM